MRSFAKLFDSLIHGQILVQTLPDPHDPEEVLLQVSCETPTGNRAEIKFRYIGDDRWVKANAGLALINFETAQGLAVIGCDC